MRAVHRYAPIWAAVLCSSLVLRPPLAVVGPLIPSLQTDLGVSHSIAGLIPAVLLLAMGLSSLSAPMVVRRVGWVWTTTAMLALIVIASVARAVAPSATLVILLSIPIGIGAGIGGASLPAAIADLYRDRRAAGTAIHALGINLGALTAAALAVPIADAFGGWRGAFVLFAIVGVCLSLVWVLGTRNEDERTPPPTLALPIHNPRAWALTCLFALQGLCYYGFGAWLADAYVEQGWSQSTAGELIAVLTAAAVPTSFIVPRIAGRLGSRVTPLLSCTVALVTGSFILAEWPKLAWVGATIVGLSLGGLFSLCLLLAVDLGRRTREVAGFAGMMLGFGYAVSAAAPLALGVARDAAGSFQAALWLMVAVAISIFVFLVSARRLLVPAKMLGPETDSSPASSQREPESARARTP
jgi:CP family cyanate transporter-like MFS transporter